MSTPYQFPTLSSGSRPDSKQWTVEHEDPSMATPMEGGYMVTRAKHTRTPRMTWNVGYQQLTNADRQAIVDHWNTVKGGSASFDWYNHQDFLTYEVRFKSGTQLTWKYVGIGPTQRWDCSFIVEQV